MKLLNAKTILGNLVVAACLVSPGARGLSVDNEETPEDAGGAATIIKKLPEDLVPPVAVESQGALRGLSVDNEQTPEDAAGAATTIKKLPEDLVPPVAVESQGALRGSSGRSAGAGAGVERALKGCSSQKLVSIYRFCIEGDCDPGSTGEHRFRLDGEWLWNGFRDFKEGLCTNVSHSPRYVEAWKSITVGTEEEDDFFSENDKYFADMSGEEWYLDTCEPYEVRLAVQHSSTKYHTTCFNVSAAYKGLSARANHCTNWRTPAESFIFLLKVEPSRVDNPVGWHDIDDPKYNCEWYGRGNNCRKYGDGFRNYGKTANEACVVCGGGI